MKIRPRNIPKFDGGGNFNLLDWINNNTNYYNWYSSLYPNAQILAGEPLKQRNNYWNKNQLSSSHYTTDDLKRSAYNNYLYTNDYDAREEDLIRWAEALSDLGTISDLDFVNRYNTQALTIRDAREAPLTYNKLGYSGTNRTFRNMFYNRSKQGVNVPLYTIGYQENLDDIEGTSTWQRRMDRYEKKFEDDTPEGLKNRIFTIIRPDGKPIKVYKKENGDIGLFSELQNNPNNPNNPGGEILAQHKEGGYGFDWNKLKTVGSKVLNNPNLLGLGRLAGNLYNNARVYDEYLKGIKPDLINPYNTHRQVIGDEATKQAYYKRAAQGQTKAGRAITSDADRQLAYQMEAKRVGDELREKGDLADNAEIRRTSDESNQHQWANIQRATEVANRNRASINRAEAYKHNVLAQKHSAQWSSIDNFLQGLEYEKRKKNAEAQSIRDEIFALQLQQDLLDDPEIVNAANNLLKIATKNTDKTTGIININDEVREALKNLKRARLNATRRLLESKEEYFRTRMKEGGKVTKKRKYKDDLLYKSVLDVVKHFQVMSKLSSDALNRKPVKIEKLAPHPKGNTRRYLLGGVAPFTIFKPVALGGETTTSTETGTSSTRATSPEDKTKQDLTKKLFESLQAEGLPSDVNLVYSLLRGLFQQQELFGNDLSSDEIQSMYIQQMLNLNLIKFNKAQFDKVAEIVRNKDAGDEMAIDLYGRVAVLDEKTGEIFFVDPKKSKIDPSRILTNNSLLLLRAFSPLAAFDRGNNILYTVSNATSLSEISKYLKAQLPTLGNSESTLEGYTNKETNDIKAGIELLKNAPDGDYKYTIQNKQQEQQARMAINYLKTVLPKNMKTLLDIKADLEHLSADLLIASLVGSRMSYTNSIKYDAVTGKASKSSSGEGAGEGKGGLKLDAATALITGKGYKSIIELNPESSYSVKAIGRFSEFLTHSGENMGAGISLQQATTSTLKGVLDWNKATLGGSRIIPTAYNQVILNNGEVAGVDLPVDPNNPNVPNFEVLKQLENLDRQLKLNNIEDSSENWKQVNDICDKIGIPKKYDSSGKLNLNSWKRFAAFQVTAPDTVLVDKNVILDMVGTASDEERELYTKYIQTNNKDKDFELSDKFLGIIGHRDELYKGTIFVPIKENIVASAISSGLNIGMDKATDLELREMGYDSSKISQYKKSLYKL